jgi:pimeloyl-ACP methyl ester carboxylesterase
MKSHEMRIAVPDPRGRQQLELAATLHLPDDASTVHTVLFCVPGGSYGRDYFDVTSAAHAGYSSAQWWTATGLAVLAIDSLGTGDSSRPEDDPELTLESAAEAHASAVTEVRRLLEAGDLTPDLAPTTEAKVVGVGHSLGGALVLIQQSRSRSFDAVGVLGFTNLHLENMYVPHEREDELTPEERREWAKEHIPQRSWNRSWSELEPYFMLPRENLRAWFHAADVPADLIEEEEARETVIPREVALESIMPACTAPYAATIDTPVFLAFGSADVSPAPREEVATYPMSNDVTLVVLPRSGHCHNYSSDRELLWTRLASWVTALP